MPIKPPIFRTARQGLPQQTYERERGSARQRGYTTHWDTQAKHYKHENPLCLGCEAVGRVTATSVVDHIIPHRGDQKLFWDTDNRQPACDPHHNVVKQVLEQRYAMGQAKATDLKLNSAMAIELTRQLLDQRPSV